MIKMIHIHKFKIYKKFMIIIFNVDEEIKDDIYYYTFGIIYIVRINSIV